MNTIRLHSGQGVAVNLPNGNRLGSCKDIITMRTWLRDIFHIDEMPPLRSDMAPWTPDELDDIVRPLPTTDSYGNAVPA